MCVVSEELSRGYIGVGSLATRSEIAAELIIAGGTEEQKQKWLPQGHGQQDVDHPRFAHPDHDADGAHRPCDRQLQRPVHVLGYRGMKEYEIAFDNFHVKGENLLGGEEGKGFKQLMETFESARIQTAARAIGVAQSALDISMQYAIDRKQFGKSLINFPRVSSKLAMMAVEIMVARQLTYFSAFEKDEGRRCDVEAGMAKLLGARVAWAAADNGLQIHGGNGFALEYKISRVLCDARILNIFEGAAEIQAQVIARRIMG